MSLWKPYIDDVPLDLSKPKGIENIYQPEITPSSRNPSPGRSSSGYDAVPQNNPVTPIVNNSSSLKRPLSPIVDSDGLSDDEEFQRFKGEALKAMAEKNGGTLLPNNPRMRRSVLSRTSGPDDDAYRRRRDRNNVAAKQSRDKRKLREIHLNLKVAYLRRQFAALKSVMGSQHCSCCRQTFFK